MPTLKGRSKIKEGECLLSLGKTRSFTTNVESRYQKKIFWATNMTFGIHDKTPDVIR